MRSAPFGNGRLRSVLTGVYLRADVPDNPLNRVRAAALAVSPSAVVCDRTAAWLLGVDTLERRELEIMPPLESLVLRGHSPTNRSECAGGRRDLRSRDICVVEGIAVTTPLRTALDLGCKLSRRGALAPSTGSGGCTASPASRWRRSCRATSGGAAWSSCGSWSRWPTLVRSHRASRGPGWPSSTLGCPPRSRSLWVHEHGRRVFRVDLAYPRSMVVVEYDGREFHDSLERREHDRRRRGWLEDRGWTVIVVEGLVHLRGVVGVAA